MLSVDTCGEPGRYDGATPNGPHDTDQNIALEDGVTLKAFILLRGYKPPPAWGEVIGNDIVKTDYGDTLWGKFMMQKLATKRTRPNAALTLRYHRRHICDHWRLSKHFAKKKLFHSLQHIPAGRESTLRT